MDGTSHFKRTIEAYLVQYAAKDELFAATYQKSNKSIDNCITYILNEVKRSGCNGFTDEEIFSMAIHYYDEDNIETGSPVSCSVVVNHTVELTEEEKAEIRRNAIKRAEDEYYYCLTKRKERKKNNTPKNESKNNQQLTLLF